MNDIAGYLKKQILSLPEQARYLFTGLSLCIEADHIFRFRTADQQPSAISFKNKFKPVYDTPAA